MEIDNKLIKNLVENSEDIGIIERKITNMIATFKVELEEKQQKETEIKEAIRIAMVENDIKKFENDVISLTYIAPTTRTTLDSARLKLERPVVWREYIKVSNVKGSIRIKIK